MSNSSASDKYPRGDTPVHNTGKEGGTKSSNGSADNPATIALPQDKHYGFVPHGLIGSKK